MISLPLMLLLSAAPAQKPDAEKSLVAVPVAVMPFKDLTGDPEYAWLGVGIAETMIVDLRKGSNVSVVERTQIDHALGELRLQGAQGAEESTAARVGKMVGARTVVLGSYQKVDRQLRIVARFVDVETGVVKEAAKVTGEATNVFAMQDEIVQKLAGTPLTNAARRRSSGAKAHADPASTVRAYKAYAQSLSARSDADRMSLLEQSLKEDPDFSYAADDLLDLQIRLQRYNQAHEKAMDTRIRAGRAALADRSLAADVRLQKVMQLLGDEQSTRRYHGLLVDTAEVLTSDLPDDGVYHIKAYALFVRMQAYAMIKERGLAMQVGEHFLEAYPDSTYYTAVQSIVAVDIGQQARSLEKARTFDAELTLEDLKIAKARQERAKQPRPANAAMEWSEDFNRCSVMEGHEQYVRAAACLHEMLDHRVPELTIDRYRGVWLRTITAEVDSGHFDAAYRDLAAFVKDDPAGGLQFGSTLPLGWPTD